MDDDNKNSHKMPPMVVTVLAINEFKLMKYLQQKYSNNLNNTDHTNTDNKMNTITSLFIPKIQHRNK